MADGLARVSGLPAVCLVTAQIPASGAGSRGQWSLGDPIVTWYAGRPELSDQSAELMRAGGWNVVWCSEAELDGVLRHGFRLLERQLGRVRRRDGLGTG